MSADLRTTSSTRALSWDSDLSQLACRDNSPFTRRPTSECGWRGVWICVVQQTMSTWGAIVWRVFVVSQHLITQSECICATHKAEKWCINPLNGSHSDTEIWQLQELSKSQQIARSRDSIMRARTSQPSACRRRTRSPRWDKYSGILSNKVQESLREPALWKSRS